MNWLGLARRVGALVYKVGLVALFFCFSNCRTPLLPQTNVSGRDKEYGADYNEIAYIYKKQ
jgi:hypothetical protein